MDLQTSLMNTLQASAADLVKLSQEHGKDLFSATPPSIETVQDFVKKVIESFANNTTDPNLQNTLRSLENSETMSEMSKRIGNSLIVIHKNVRNIQEPKSPSEILDQVSSELNQVTTGTKELKDNVLSDKEMSTDQNSKENTDMNDIMTNVVNMLNSCTNMTKTAENHSKSKKSSRKVKFSKHTESEDNDDNKSDEGEEEWEDTTPEKLSKKCSHSNKDEEESDEDDESRDREYDNEWSAFHKLVDAHQGVVEAYVHLLNKYAGIPEEDEEDEDDEDDEE